MVSNINPTFPTAGIDQPSQGFRDNFGFAKVEIEALQSDVGTLQGTVITVVDDISDITITAPATNDFLRFNLGTGQWENVSFEIALDTTPQLGGNLDVDGFNITMSGAETVDGRDLSVDGAKLDGIESGATADQTDADIRGLGFFDITNDGTGSGLDADLLDGLEATAFATAAEGSLASSALQNVVEDTTPQLGGELDAQLTHKIVNLVDPTSAQDAATKKYVDDEILLASAIVNIVEDITPQLGGQLDVNTFGIGDGTNLLLNFVEDAFAVNHIEIENEATGSGPVIRSAGADTNIDLNLAAKGTGVINITGNVTVSGTVDGRDLFVDGAKLDLIEDNATADQTAVDIRALGFFDITNDGTGSGLDADLLDGLEATAFATVVQGFLADSALQNIVEDDTPQLGGQLDVNTFGIGDGTNLLLNFVEDAFAVNHIEIENEGVGAGPIIRSAGTDSNIDLNLAVKGTGVVNITGNVTVSGTVDGRDLSVDGTKLDLIEDNATQDQTAAEILAALITVDGSGTLLDADFLDGLDSTAFLQNVVEDTTPVLGGQLGHNGFGVVDIGSNLILDFSSPGGSPVNHIQIENALTGSGAVIRSTGADTNIDIRFSPKGTGVVNVTTSRITNVVDPTSAQNAATKNYVDTQGFVKTSDNNTFTKAQRGAPVAIASSVTITPDFDAGNNFEIDTIATNFTLANPTNMTNAAGQSGVIVIVQDGTGSRLLSAVGTFWKFSGGTLPTLSTGIGAVDTITYYVRSSTFIVGDVVLDAQ